MEIHQSTVILLLLLCVSSYTHAQPAHTMRRYQNFLNHHRGPYVNVEMCTDVIRDRKITDSAGYCKPVNSFIRAPDHLITAVCSGGTRLYYNLFRSGTPFDVVTCRLKSGQTHPDCEYDRGRLSIGNIVLGCEHGLPVHYEMDGRPKFPPKNCTHPL
uniref:Ribonuclease like 2 n=1 Tax=Cyprinus carpio TaxID=7962 RepID=A0A8C2F1P0_CYPCA